ncbi:hypothetical protein [Wolbachia endosymbiont of Brugia malayi]|nr:hypothetical protein [Wolbachia endosymbiont of Brugia malayi]
MKKVKKIISLTSTETADQELNTFKVSSSTGIKPCFDSGSSKGNPTDEEP